MEVVQFSNCGLISIYITLPLGESSLSEERAMRIACLKFADSRIAHSGCDCVRHSLWESQDGVVCCPEG